MYADPADIRDNPVKPRFNDAEYAAVIALARLNKSQPATFVRDLVLRHLAAFEPQGSGDAHVA